MPATYELQSTMSSDSERVPGQRLVNCPIILRVLRSRLRPPSAVGFRPPSEVGFAPDTEEFADCPRRSLAVHTPPCYQVPRRLLALRLGAGWLEVCRATIEWSAIVLERSAGPRRPE